MDPTEIYNTITDKFSDWEKLYVRKKDYNMKDFETNICMKGDYKICLDKVFIEEHNIHVLQLVLRPSDYLAYTRDGRSYTHMYVLQEGDIPIFVNSVKKMLF